MSERPSYKVTAQTYLDRLYEPGEVVEFDGAPNRALKPLNEAAELAVLEAAERKPGVVPPSPASLTAEPDPRIAELEAKVETLSAELNEVADAAVAAEETVAELRGLLTLAGETIDAKDGDIADARAAAAEAAAETVSVQAEFAAYRERFKAFDKDGDDKPGGSKKGA